MDVEGLSALLALTLGVGWASGINLYAATFALGLAGSTGYAELPASLELIEHPLVIGAAGIAYVVEFFADKIPGVDTLWDVIHTFIRIPAGALLAAGVVGDQSQALSLAAGLLGGGVAAASHATKAGTRALLNTSPEPVTNWTASVAEDVSVLGGVWLMLNHPLFFLGAFVLFVLICIWLLPRIYRGLKLLFSKIRRPGRDSA